MNRSFVVVLAFATGACRTPEKITKSDVVDASPAPAPSTPPSVVPAPVVTAPAPLRAIPTGEWSSADQARVQLRISGARVTLTEHLEHERAPLIAEGSYASTMAKDGSFVVGMKVDDLKKEFKSRSKSKKCTELRRG